jgi:hypothetical protein
MYLSFKPYKIQPNFNNCYDIKGLRFVTKAICPWYCCFLHSKKHPRGASIHEIKESFPLKPSLVYWLIFISFAETQKSEELWHCADGKQKIPKRYRCDEWPNCIDGSDERNCTTKTGKFSGLFKSKSRFSCRPIKSRDRPRFFDQVGHQTTNASIGNKYFFTK